MAFVLLVFAVRRGTKLATAMEARGFGADVERTWARPSTRPAATAPPLRERSCWELWRSPPRW